MQETLRELQRLGETIMGKTIEQTKQFVKESFIKNPSYSFNNWKIMYNHSLKVMDTALEISNITGGDKLILSLRALLHDIGKTFNADETALRHNHEDFNYLVARNFIDSLGLSTEQNNKLQNILNKNSDLLEKQIIKDADIIAYFTDRELQQVFKQWTEDNNLPHELQRKQESINNLRFDVSKKILKL